MSHSEDQPLSISYHDQTKSDNFSNVLFGCPLCGKLFYPNDYSKFHDHVLKSHVESLAQKENNGNGPSLSTPIFRSRFDCQPKLATTQAASRFVDSTNHCENLPTMCNLNSSSVLLGGSMGASQQSNNSMLWTTSIGGDNPTAQIISDHQIEQTTASNSMYNCPLCPFMDSEAQGMARHITLEHTSYCLKSQLHDKKSSKFACPHCPKTYKSSSKLAIHLLAHSEELPFACPQCSFKTKTNDRLDRHILKKHRDLIRDEGSIATKMLQCPECPRMLDSNSKLIIHSRVHTGERPFACSECNYKAKQKRHLRAHIKNIHQKVTIEKPNKTFRCLDCPYTFKKIGSLIEHTRTHTGERPFQCSVCGHKTRFNHELITHMALHQNVVNGKFESRPLRNCPHCPYKNFSLLKLTEHMKLHDGEHPFECNQCDYKAKSEEHLKYHKTIHQNGKLFKCSQCDYATNKENALLNHMKDHSGEQKYSCQDCGRTFKYKHLLKRHMANIHNIKPFKCPEPNCDFATAVRNSFDLHSKLHVGAPRYSCIECEYKCHTLTQIYNHEAIHYGKGPFKCPDCSFVSIHRASIRRHRKEGGRGYTCVVITRSKRPPS